MGVFDKILDGSIYFSFDRTGYERHAKAFKQEVFDGSEQVAIVTGANSGLGFSVTQTLCRSGVHVLMLCRSKQRGEFAIKEILSKQPDARVDLYLVDLSEPASIFHFLKEEALPKVDILVNNAGGMPDALTYNLEGEEVVWTTHVVGSFLLTEGLIEEKLLKPSARIILVSSGGMYTQKLDVSDLNCTINPYNKYVAYANAKRAQVILNKYWNLRYPSGYRFSCMHPGWAKTSGIEKAMPEFYRWIKNRLRSPEQGADTINWLALTQERYPGGKFWFDRKEAKTHILGYGRETTEVREAFIDSLYRFLFNIRLSFCQESNIEQESI